MLTLVRTDIGIACELPAIGGGTKLVYLAGTAEDGLTLGCGDGGEKFDPFVGGAVNATPSPSPTAPADSASADAWIRVGALVRPRHRERLSELARQHERSFSAELRVALDRYLASVGHVVEAEQKGAAASFLDTGVRAA